MDSVSVPAVAASIAVMVLGGGAPLAAALILNWRDRVKAKGVDQ
ncbi:MULTISPECIES: hypothetical protein [Gordonia]|jgi:hypothetical protein|uniref:Uncharacterized protein n=2 Tax=Gordonia alkanivorans TaxID=84096 RepID=W9DF72_9ACTN|nr:MULTISPECIES: hypothetical protein [Gordonia]ETA05066.1 hypothetical protein V525_20960 [Gordonia alkanivorans CGMCC 6845]MDH3008263.1 hypothetical protein [Gordonia alkanivorans]MDH3012068.1 hypothetical protein [Gordonia alkanivorans]MDH3017205.1 hypothetical protein [Gordonia alkanivorans]MDH3021277.1 hypothetical protein [Gordonia alkanivorans]